MVFALVLLEGMEQVIGKTDLNSLLTSIGLERYIDHYPPPNSIRAIDFADITALRTGLNQKYGLRGGEEYAAQIGRLMFINLLRYFGRSPVLGEILLGSRPDWTAQRIVPAMTYILSSFSDQVSTAIDEGDHFIFTLSQCPFCWKQKTARPLCHIVQGIFDDGLSRFTVKHISGDRIGKYHYRIQIASCSAKGDDMGRLIIYKMPTDIRS